jgi:hypothetical protein
MTDSKGVKLTGQEAVSEDIGRNIAILPWQVIDRVSLSGGDATGIDADAPGQFGGGTRDHLLCLQNRLPLCQTI